MKELTCIGCPRGRTLKIERDGNGWSVTGNTCPRGREFAISEMTAPKRTICSTVRTAFPDAPVLPVRVSADIPKDRIFDVMDALKTVTVSERIGRGDVVIPNVLGLGVDVIASKPLVLTCDIGTQSARALLVDPDGRIVDVVQSKYAEPYFSKEPGWAEQKPNFYFDRLCECCRT